MEKFFNSHNRRFFAVGMLSVLLFVFLHSELDQFSHHEDDHASHDYCQLVDAASTRVHTVQNSVAVKQLVTAETGIVDTNFFGAEIQRLLRIRHPMPGRLYPTIEIFLQNTSFLI